MRKTEAVAGLMLAVSVATGCSNEMDELRPEPVEPGSFSCDGVQIDTYISESSIRLKVTLSLGKTSIDRSLITGEIQVNDARTNSTLAEIIADPGTFTANIDVDGPGNYVVLGRLRNDAGGSTLIKNCPPVNLNIVKSSPTDGMTA